MYHIHDLEIDLGITKQGVFMIIANSCVTSVFFHGIFSITAQENQYNKKKHVCQGFILIDVLCVKI